MRRVPDGRVQSDVSQGHMADGWEGDNAGLQFYVCEIYVQ